MAPSPLFAFLLAAAAAPEARLIVPADVFTLKTVADPRMSPDGQFVAYTVESNDAKTDESDTDVYMSPVAGGDAVRLTASDKDETWPRWSPDGRYLAFLAERDDDEAAQVYLLDRRGGEATRLTSEKGDVTAFEWSPDGTRLAMIVDDPKPMADEKSKSDKDKRPRPIVTRRLQFKDDERGYLTAIRRHIRVFTLATRTSAALTFGPYDDAEPAWSPDGRHVAFVSNRTSDPDANFDTDVFVARVDAKEGEHPRMLTSSPSADASPVFSPDGRTVAYVAGGGEQDFWYAPTFIAAVPFAGGPAKALTQALDRWATTPRFSPDGRFVYFLLEDRGNVHLGRVPAEGGTVDRVVGGERVVEAYDVSAQGGVAVAETSAHQPTEVSSVGENGMLRRVTTTNDAVVNGLRLAPFTRHVAKSPDGTEIDYFVARPADAAAGAKLPTLLRVHGGPVLQFTTGFNFEWQVYAAAGYAVVGANPRGSSGRGRDFSRAIWADWGNKDVADVLAATDAVVAAGVADPARLVVGGHSYGGMMTNYIIARTDRFKAAISLSGGGFYLGNYGPDQYHRHYEYELGLPWRNPQAYLKLSYPFLLADRITTPILYMGGDLDQNVPLMNTEQMYQVLRRLHRDTELVIYPGEHHDLARPSFLKDYYERSVAWYDARVKPKPAAEKP